MLMGLGLTLLSLFFVILTMLGLGGNTWLMLLAAVYAVYNNFVYMNGSVLAWMLILYLIGEAWDFGISFFGIRRAKISYSKIIVIGIGTIIGSFAGTIILPILGSVLGATFGAFAAAYIVEVLSGNDRSNAWRIAYVAASMQVLALGGKVIIGCIMFIMLIANVSWR